MLLTQQATKLFHCTNRPVGSTHLLYSAAFRTLAAPTKKSTKPNPTNTSSARLQLVSRQLSTSASNISSSLNMSPRYTVRKVGPANTLEHRIYIEKDGVPVSPFHDIPLYANDQQTTLNMIVEIPRWTNGKLEVCRASCTWPMGRLTSKMHRGFWPGLLAGANNCSNRSRKRKSSILSSKISRKANSALSAIAFLTKAISGTTVPSHKRVALETSPGPH